MNYKWGLESPVKNCPDRCLYNFMNLSLESNPWCKWAFGSIIYPGFESAFFFFFSFKYPEVEVYSQCLKTYSPEQRWSSLRDPALGGELVKSEASADPSIGKGRPLLLLLLLCIYLPWSYQVSVAAYRVFGWGVCGPSSCVVGLVALKHVWS